MDLFGVLTLFGGIALFLYGMRVMGEGIEKRAGKQMRIILEKLTANPLKSILLGAAVTPSFKARPQRRSWSWASSIPAL